MYLGHVGDLRVRRVLDRVRLAAWECNQHGIPYVVQADGAAASTILRGFVDFAVIGADRIARNGDTANKIGSGNEVTRWSGLPTTPAGARGFNPAFDVTPAAHISAVDTELGIVEPGPGVTVDTIAGETS